MPRARVPASLILLAGLLAAGALGAGGSLSVQRWQTQTRNAALAHELTGGDPARGRQAFSRYGCGACHQISMNRDAAGRVGPPLDHIATRAYLAGDLPNAPGRLAAWIQHPQSIQPGVGMPDMGVTDADARDIAAYLYTLQ